MEFDDRLRDRRRFLLASLSVAGTSFGARGNESSPTIELPDLRAMIRDARRTLRPLLFLIDGMGPGSRSHVPMWSSYLVGASDERLAALAIVDPVCTQVERVREACSAEGIPDHEQVSTDCLFVMLMPAVDGANFVLRSFESPPSWWGDEQLPPKPEGMSQREALLWEEYVIAHSIVKRDDRVAEFFSRELGQSRGERAPESVARAEYVVQCARSRLSAAELELVDSPPSALAGLSPQVLRRAAPILLERARQFDVYERAEIHSALARLVKRDWIWHEPPGGIWGTRPWFGCDRVEYDRFVLREGAQKSSFQCGMAFVPEREYRFLAVLTERDVGRLEKKRR